MSLKLTSLAALFTFATASFVSAQSASPSASPTASPSPAKHHHKKAAAMVSPSPVASVSPSPSKFGSFFKKKATTASSPAASVSKGATSTVAAASSPVTSKATKAVSKTTPAPGGGNGMVWVNTTSHVYHKEGSAFYGKTKAGKYMSEADALKEGDRAAKESKEKPANP